MADVEIRFEREGLEGIVAVGTYLRDALRRFGIRFDCNRGNSGLIHDCAVTISHGRELLTPRTKAEIEFFGEETDSSRRLACEARIEKAGEITVMTDEKVNESKSETSDKRERYLKEFADLPLDKKFSDLVKLEAIALGETVSFILNSPYKVIEKIGDVMADLGRKLDAEQRKASRPAEHNGSDNGSVSEKADTKTATEQS
jgi:ferredoxin